MDIALSEAFLSCLLAKNTGTGNTVQAYRIDLNQFQKWLNHEQLNNWDQVNPEVVNNYFNWLGYMNYKENTIARKIATIRSFFNFLASEHVVEAGRLETVRTPHRPKTIPITLSSTELSCLVKLLEADSRIEAQRDLVIIRLIIDTGWKVSQVINLNLTDIHLEEESAWIRSAEDNQLVLTTEVANGLRNYLNQIRPKLAKAQHEDALWINIHGERLTRQGVWEALKKLAPSLDIPKGRLTPDTLRNTAASRRFAAGQSSAEVQRFLHLASTNAARRYRRIATV